MWTCVSRAFARTGVPRKYEQPNTTPAVRDDLEESKPLTAINLRDKRKEKYSSSSPPHNKHTTKTTLMQIRAVLHSKAGGIYALSIVTNRRQFPITPPSKNHYSFSVIVSSGVFIHATLLSPARNVSGTASDSAGMRSSRPPAALAAGQAADDDGEEGDNGVDDSLDSGSDGINNSHDAVSNGAEDALDLFMLLVVVVWFWETGGGETYA
jgi:hypothetical protein